MHARRARRRDHGFARGVGIEPGDIFRDVAVEQLDILRQIADIAAERFAVPLVERRAIQSDRAAQRLPSSGKGARQRRFSRCRRTDDAQPVAGLKREADVLQDRPLLPGRGDEQVGDGDRLFRPGQRQGLGLRRQIDEHRRETLIALPRRDEAPPIGDGALRSGASARDAMMEQAIITPAVASPLITT